MSKAMDWMQNSFAPSMQKITKNSGVAAIQNTFQQILPMILVGSLVSLLSTFKNFMPFLPDFSIISSFSFSLLGIFVSFLIPYNILEKKKVNRYKLIAGFTGVATFMMLSKPTFDKSGGATFEFARLGAGGLFVSLIIGVIIGYVMFAVLKKGIFPKDTVLPDIIVSWFESLIPITAILVVTWILAYKLNFDMFKIITTLCMPLTTMGETYIGFVLLIFVCVFVFSFGVSAWALTPILYTIYLSGIAENAKNFAAGLPVTNIATLEVQFAGWCAIGGLGCTLPLCVMMLKSRSDRIKGLARVSILPSIFNINEPVVFGLPIAWNPLMMVPFWINGFIIPSVTYIALRGGLVTIPHKVFAMQFLPEPISTYLTNSDWRGVVLWVILVAIATIVWYPFFKVYEKIECKKELAEKEEKLKAAESV